MVELALKFFRLKTFICLMTKSVVDSIIQKKAFEKHMTEIWHGQKKIWQSFPDRQGSRLKNSLIQANLKTTCI